VQACLSLSSSITSGAEGRRWQILLNTMPKSGSVYILKSLAQIWP
jgi:hypothetical protein